MASRRTAIAGFAVALLVGIVGLLVAGAARESRQVQTLGVTPVYPVAPLDPGQEACQDGVGLAEPVERVRFHAGTFGKPGQPMDVTVRTRHGGQIGKVGHEPGGWKDDGSAQEVAVGRVAGDQIVSVCIRNRGRLRLNVYGDLFSGSIRDSVVGVRPTVTPSTASIDGTGIEGDLAIAFTAREPRSLLTRLPDMFSRASSFRPGFVGPWIYWLLLAAALLVVPFALVRALVTSLEDDEERPPADQPPRRATSRWNARSSASTAREPASDTSR